MRLLIVISAIVFAASLQAQMASMADPESIFLMQQVSGTDANPGEEHHGLMFEAGQWHVMAHGVIFANDIRATGFRGQSKRFSTNWGMFSAQRQVGGGHLLLRSMLSLEPATISNRKYPELFQTGETAFGKQIIDGQHPHDFFMELAAEYARSFTPRTIWYVYLAPVGSPALGPVAFPHRASAMEIPQAVLGHHFQDSTHIAYDVVTSGIKVGPIRVEGSAFHGAEPDEERWDLDGGRIDSGSGRIVFTPISSLSVQASAAFLTKPEKLEPGDQRRWTASASYTRGSWASSLVWGRIYKESHDITLESYLAESTLRLWRRNWLSLRLEDVDKDELFPHFHRTGKVERPPLPVPVFRIRAATFGYTYDFWVRNGFTLGAGANYTWYRFPSILQGFYGERPRTRLLLLRLRVT